MIRHVLLARCNSSATAERIEELRSALTSLPCPGRLAFSMGVDLGLNASNADLAMVSDFEDHRAFLAYDADDEHDQIRRELFAPIVERVERCQFQI